MDAIAQAGPDHDARWQRLCAHPFEEPSRAIDFTRRLAREQGWTLAQARAAVEEYRRFCFLACAGHGAMTPSRVIDEVWHLHLTYTRDYWQLFCPGVLGMSLHHAPTGGGRAEARRHREQYAHTLAHYEQYFGDPPEAFWPAATENFAAAPAIVRIERERYWLVRRPRWRRLGSALAVLAAGALGAGAALAQAANPLDWEGGDFLRLYLALAPIAIVAAVLLRRQLRDTGAARGRPQGPLELAYLAGGPQRCVDAGVAQLLAEGKASWDESGRRLHLQAAAHGEAPPLDWIAQCIAADGSPAKVLERGVSRLQELRRALVAKGLWLDDGAAWNVRLLSTLPVQALWLLGLAKIGVGLARERPVAFLVILSIVLGAILAGMLLTKPTRTRAGDAALAEARLQHGRLTRAPRAGEVGIAVALLGTVALAGTAWAGYHDVRTPPSGGDASSSSGDSGGSSDSGGDSGGGGCGGCGGGD